MLVSLHILSFSVSSHLYQYIVILAYSAPPCSYAYSCILNCFADLLDSDLGAGMVLNKEKWVRLANTLARRPGVPGVAGASAPSAPVSATVAPPSALSAPITTVPLTVVQASPAPSPLEKRKGVVEVVSDKDSAEGPVFKRRRVMEAPASHSTTKGRPASFRENPPSVSTTPGPLTLEGGGESALGNEQTPPAPELPVVLQHTLKGFQRGTVGELRTQSVM